MTCKAKTRESIEERGTMKRLTAACVVAVGALVMAGTASATTVYSNNFDDPELFASGVSGGFSGAGSVTGVEDYGTNAATSSAGFAGSFLRNSSTGVPAPASILTLTGLGSHTSIDIDFLLGIIDSWDGSVTSVAPDLFNVRVDGALVYSESYDQFDLLDQSASTSNLIVGPDVTLGFSPGWGESAYDMGVVSALTGIAHTGSSLTVEFFAGGAGWQGSIDESFAIENVAVTTNAIAVPAPGTLMLVVLGMVGIAGMGRRRGSSA
jgi:hypothetical protein